MFATPPLGYAHLLQRCALAYTGSKRPVSPDVPIMAEAGSGWCRRDELVWPVRPAKPQRIITRLYRTTPVRILSSAAAIAQRQARSTPAAFRKFVEAEVKRFAEMVKLAGYQPSDPGYRNQ
jgi:tripartite-type tricarboxylate transporter receptor subunit TctC